MLKLYDIAVQSRLLLGTARYPSPAILAEAVRRSKTEIVTVSLRRETSGGKASGELKTLFRPADVTVGPDGALYVADWFDPRVGGNLAR